MSSHSTLEELEIVKFGRALPHILFCLFCNLIYVFKCFFVLLRRLPVWLFWVGLNEIWFLFFKKKTVYLWLKHVNKDTFIDKKLIHPRYTSFACGNLSAPTLRSRKTFTLSYNTSYVLTFPYAWYPSFVDIKAWFNLLKNLSLKS